MEYDKTISDVFNEAADLYEFKGYDHLRLSFTNADNSRICMGRAIEITSGAVTVLGKYAAIFRETRLCHLAYLFANTKLDGDVIYWNDKAGRTKDEVIAKLRELAKEAAQ